MNPMLQNALPAVLLLAIMVGIALALKWARGRVPGLPGLPGASAARGPSLQLLTSLSVGPQQRVITVQVDDGQNRTCLVLGVAAGSITALHSLPMPATPATEAPAATPLPGGFAARLAQLTGRKDAHGPQ
ncbi:flagellar biosynthetic protein FliO [Hydrogenophaga sp. IBVHS2]|uniref:FliO/MopB family protein n=1 Tax=Hydrogenophaga sp. IBVHS2 TaxID=1985170 RepID=UPI000A2D7C5D|nr:flagellar biosynthetic protein FliO [Hydrogenophaga sp. IBVHS2]OSZ67224.1 hypothetical protein CAP38_00070 [Hydrogenophaga sp. IBVHS2]